MTTMKDMIVQLEREHWNGIIALATRAEGADDLNVIIDRLMKFDDYLHGYRSELDIEDVCTKIEKSITQWPEFEKSEIREDVWKMPLMWGSNFGRTFKKDDNTVVLWDDIAGGYIECKRVTKGV